MIQYIFPLDTIDEGRKKINNLLFTGITPTGYWSFINTGTTYFSLEVSGLTSSYPTENEDTTSLSRNVIVGSGNTLSGSGGFNFVQGFDNYVASSKNSFIGGNDNSITGLTNSFVFGTGIKIFSGNSITINPAFNVVFSSSTINNNYVSVLASETSIIQSLPSSSNKKQLYLSILNNQNLAISADTSFVTMMPGSSSIISGTVINSSVFGLSNKIGYNQTNVVTDNYDNIFIFGNTLSPVLSATTFTPLSGTYINDLCIEKGLTLNLNSVQMAQPPTTYNIEFEKFNNFLIYRPAGIPTSTGDWSVTANFPKNSSLLTGLFFISYYNQKLNYTTVAGDVSSFIDDYGYGSRWDMPSNTYSANTVFAAFSQTNTKYIRYKG